MPSPSANKVPDRVEKPRATKPTAPNPVSVETPSATERSNPPLAAQINQEAWLLEQDPNFFTLQLVAGYQKSTVNNFIKLHKLANDNLAYYHSLNKGKDWNSLVYGIYPDYRSALLAINDLPEGVRQARPWIRQLKSVQEEIKEAER